MNICKHRTAWPRCIECHADTYRGWTLSFDPPPIPIRDFDWSATGPNFDASWEGEEDGWVGNGEQVFARTRIGVIEEINAWFEEQSA